MNAEEQQLAPIGIRPLAVIYLRVSTKDQASRGGEAEGFSIPAQREACLRKADSLGAVVSAEFVDAGESARSANRPVSADRSALATAWARSASSSWSAASPASPPMSISRTS